MRNTSELITERDVRKSAQGSGPLHPDDERAMRRIFQVLHGYYGNLLLSKFQTGRVVETGTDKGEDEGMSNARRIWTYGLREFDSEVIRAALRDTQTAYPKFPPSLPEFQALCRARAPRGRSYQTNAEGKPVLLAMSPKLYSRYAAQARAINERHAQRKNARAEGATQADAGPGLASLKQSIANAVATAGGDEAATLLRLDRELAQKASHVE